MSFIWLKILLLLLHNIGEIRATDGSETGGGNVLVSALSQLVRDFFHDCHLVLLSMSEISPVFLEVEKKINAMDIGVILVDGVNVTSHDLTSEDNLFRGLWGEDHFTCRALIIDLTRHSDLEDLTGFFIKSNISRKPDTPVVLVGPKTEAKVVLRHHVLRNTIHALYFALDLTRVPGRDGGHEGRHYIGTTVREHATVGVGWEHVLVYRKCLYCNAGEPDVRLLGQWTHEANFNTKELLFPDEFRNLNGHCFKAVAKRYFPYMDAKLISKEPGSKLQILDSLDTRIFLALSQYLNFTIETWSTADSHFGVPKGNGNWTGMVGALQHEQADFSCGITPTLARGEVVDFSRIYIPEPYVIVSREPEPPPQSLSLIRPLAGTVWVSLVLSVFGCGLLLWLLQKAWTYVSGRKGISLCTSLFYVVGVTLEDPPSEPPRNLSSQMLAGWWLVFCLVVTTAYKSALISHLTVQLESSPVNTFEDLVAKDGWGFGISMSGGALETFLNTSPDPVIRKLGKSLERLSEEDRGAKVIRGSYGLVEPKYYIKAIIAKNFTNSVGYSPLYVGNREYNIFPGLSFGYRRGAPFLARFSLMKQRMVEAGLMTHWIDEVFETFAVRARNEKNDDKLFEKQDNGPVVLSLRHLQGAFYLLFMGHFLAIVALVGEKMFLKETPHAPSMT